MGERNECNDISRTARSRSMAACKCIWCAARGERREERGERREEARVRLSSQMEDVEIGDVAAQASRANRHAEMQARLCVRACVGGRHTKGRAGTLWVQAETGTAWIHAQTDKSETHLRLHTHTPRCPQAKLKWLSGSTRKTSMPARPASPRACALWCSGKCR